MNELYYFEHMESSFSERHLEVSLGQVKKRYNNTLKMAVVWSKVVVFLKISRFRQEKWTSKRLFRDWRGKAGFCRRVHFTLQTTNSPESFEPTRQPNRQVATCQNRHYLTFNRKKPQQLFIFTIHLQSQIFDIESTYSFEHSLKDEKKFFFKTKLIIMSIFRALQMYNLL